MMKKFPVLYKYTTKGQIQQWQIVVNNKAFNTIEGIQGGTLTTSALTVCTPKNIGKNNETTGEQQALKEAQAKWDKKVSSGYNEVLTKEKKFIEPMLAFEYDKYPIDWTTESLVGVQPKLDGMRCISQNNTLTSRNGKLVLSAPHLNQDEMILDGELYNHDLKDNFNEIISNVRKTKPTEEDLEESASKIQYWIYDTPLSGPTDNYMHRSSVLKIWHNSLSKSDKKKFILVPTKFITSQEELDSQHMQYLSQGYEGTIIRRLHSPYEFKRSKQLLKYKDFIDEEFKIIGYEEGTGNRGGSLGAFVLQHDKDPNKTFKSNVKGTFEYLQEIWDNKDSYIGSTATVKYFQRTPDDIPRFPYIIKLKREEYE